MVKKKKSKKKVIILGLDVSSSSTGFAVLRDGRWNKSKASYGMIKPPRKLPLGEKLVYFRDELEKVIKKISPTHIVIEDVFRGRNAKTVKLLSRFSGVTVELCRRLSKKEPTIVNALQARTCIGVRKKEEAFSIITERYNLDWNFNKMNDITDAIVLALYKHKNS